MVKTKAKAKAKEYTMAKNAIITGGRAAGGIGVSDALVVDRVNGPWGEVVVTPPGYPFLVSQSQGYFLANAFPQIQGTQIVEIKVAGLLTATQYGQMNKPSQILAFVPWNKVIFSQNGIHCHRANGWAGAAVEELFPAYPIDDESATYTYRIAVYSNSAVLSVAKDGEKYTSVTLTIPGLFGDHEMYVGYPPQEVINAQHTYSGYLPADGMDFLYCGILADIGALSAEYTLVPQVQQADGTYHVANLTAYDKNGKSAGFAFALAAGLGDDDNADFSIDPGYGDRLSSPVPRKNVVKSIRISATDIYGDTTEHRLMLLFTEDLAPTDIEISNDSILEGETEVGTLTTIDPDVGDTHTYSFVEGQYDNHNALFEISDGVLSFKEASVMNDYYCRIRSTDQAGAYIEKGFLINAHGA